MIDTNNIEALIGKDVVDPEGDKIGTVGQVYLDTASGQPTWASVRTGLFGMSESFVPLRDARLDGDDLRVEYDKAFVKDAPRVDPDGGLNADEERRLYSYYSVDYDTADAEIGTSAGDETVDASSGMTGEYRADTADAYAAGTAGTAGTTGTDRTEGYDTSGPTTDDAMTRSEEQLHVGTEQVERGRARLRKYVVTENQSVTVPVSREEVRIEREPITDANADAAYDGPAISEEEHEVVLTEERVVVDKEAVPVERVSLGTETVTEEQRVTEEVRKEQIDLEDDTGTTRGRSQ
jgi:uncharacterized protein (TIGR02271 family)